MSEYSFHRRRAALRKAILPTLSVALALVLLLCSGCIPLLRWTTSIWGNFDVMLVQDGSGGAFAISLNNSEARVQLVDVNGRRLWGDDGVPISAVAGSSRSEWSAAVDGAGGVVVAYGDYSSGDWDIYAQRLDKKGNKLWGNGKQVCVQAGDQELGEVVTGKAAGEVIVLWRNGLGSSAEVRAQRLDAGGSPMWAAGGVFVSSSPEAYFSPSAVPDGAGGTIVAWPDQPDGDSLSAQRIDKNGTLIWPSGAIQVSSDAYLYTMDSDGLGGAVFCWESRSDDRAYAQRVGPGGALLWQAGGVSVCNEKGIPRYPQIVGDGSGGAIVAWSDERVSSSKFNMYAQKVTPAGSIAWKPSGVPIAGQGDHPAIASDGAGGAILAWTDGRSVYVPPGQPIYNDLNFDAYAARVDSSGNCAWLMNLSPAIYQQSALDVVPSGTGGGIVAWTTDKNLHWMYSEYDMSVTRLTSWEVTPANQSQMLKEYNKRVTEYNKKLDAERKSMKTR